MHAWLIMLRQAPHPAAQASLRCLTSASSVSMCRILVEASLPPLPLGHSACALLLLGPDAGAAALLAGVDAAALAPGPDACASAAALKMWAPVSAAVQLGQSKA